MGCQFPGLRLAGGSAPVPATQKLTAFLQIEFASGFIRQGLSTGFDNTIIRCLCQRYCFHPSRVLWSKQGGSTPRAIHQPPDRPH